MPIVYEAFNQISNPSSREKKVPIVTSEDKVDLNSVYALLERDLPVGERGTAIVIKNQLTAALKKAELITFTDLTPEQFNKFYKIATPLLRENERTFSWYGHNTRNLTNLKAQISLETAAMNVNEASIEYSSAAAINLVNQSDRYLQINNEPDKWLSSQVKNIYKATKQLESRAAALRKEILEASYNARPKEAYEAALSEINHHLEKGKALVAKIEVPTAGVDSQLMPTPIRQASVLPTNPWRISNRVGMSEPTPAVPVTAILPSRAADIAEDQNIPTQALANGHTVVDDDNSGYVHTTTDRFPVQRRRRTLRLPSLNVEGLLEPVRNLNDYLEYRMRSMKGSLRFKLPSKTRLASDLVGLGLILSVGYGFVQEYHSKGVTSYANLVFGNLQRESLPLRPNLNSPRIKVLEDSAGQVRRFILTNNAGESIELTMNKPLADRLRFDYKSRLYSIYDDSGNSMVLGDAEIKDLSPNLNDLVKDVADRNYKGSVASWFMDREDYAVNIRNMIIAQTETPASFEDLRKDGSLPPIVKNNDLVRGPGVPIENQLILAPYLLGY